MAGLRIVCNNNFKPTVRRFKYSRPQEVTARSMRIALRAAQKDSVALAKKNLKSLVYQAPLPSSVVEGRAPQNYLAVRRIGNVWKAIEAPKIMGVGTGTVMAEVKVSSSAGGFENFYYAWILNKGGMGGAYAPRPFWTMMVRMMRTRLREYGMLGLRAEKAWLLGDDTYGGLFSTGVDEALPMEGF